MKRIKSEFPKLDQVSSEEEILLPSKRDHATDEEEYLPRPMLCSMSPMLLTPRQRRQKLDGRFSNSLVRMPKNSSGTNFNPQQVH